MMGTKIRTFTPLPPEVSLEDLVPKDNFYRRLDRKVDLSFVRGLVEEIATLLRAVRVLTRWSSFACSW